MSSYRFSDAQIASALRNHLPAHARSDVRGRIAAQVATTAQRSPLPAILQPFGSADPGVRRRTMLVAAALLLAAGVAVAAFVGTILQQREDLRRITIDPAQNPPGFVLQAYAAHRELPAMTIVASVSDVAGGPSDVHRFVFDGHGRVRHECCDGHVVIQAGDLRGSTSVLDDGAPVWLIEPAHGALAGYELAEFSGLATPECPTAWRYIGPDLVVGRSAHHLACPRDPQDAALSDLELWLDAQLGIALRSLTAGAQMSGIGGPAAPSRYEQRVQSIEFGAPSEMLFEPPHGMARLTLEEAYCIDNPAGCPNLETARPHLPATTPESGPSDPQPPDLLSLIHAVHQSYADVPPMALVIEDRAGAVQGEWRIFTDGEDLLREEWHFDPSDPATATMFLNTPNGAFESYYGPDGTLVWARREPKVVNAVTFNLGLPATCDVGWRYLGLDILLGAPAWHVGCGPIEFWIDRERLLVVRRVIQPDPLHTVVDSRTVVRIVLGPQPAELFALPDDARVDTP